MKISVCMGTYNGEKYILKQLQTIYAQSTPADEVILCDDGSTDATVQIIKAFIEEKALQKSWRVYENKKNKGYPRNFYYAMSLCTGDIVFLADQDDLWHTEKIKRLAKYLNDNPNAKCVCCKFGLIDENDGDIHTIMAPVVSRESGIARKVSIEDVFYKCEWPGMVMAFQNAWYRKWAPKDRTTSIPHDFLLCARAAEEEGFVQIDEVLAYHRRHNQNVGEEEHRISRLLNKNRKLKEIENYLKNLRRFEGEGVLKTEYAKKILVDKLKSMEGRYEALQSGKVRQVVKNAWENRRLTRLMTVICDVAICMNKKQN